MSASSRRGPPARPRPSPAGRRPPARRRRRLPAWAPTAALRQGCGLAARARRSGAPTARTASASAPGSHAPPPPASSSAACSPPRRRRAPAASCERAVNRASCDLLR
eukprot:scaffold13970_cov101-Isochrysis_galbana.AAC.3